MQRHWTLTGASPILREQVTIDVLVSDSKDLAVALSYCFSVSRLWDESARLRSVMHLSIEY